MMKILVVAAHPDDEVLGAGGTIARHAAAGDQVTIVICGEGHTSRYAERADASKRALAALRKQANAASEILGARALHFLSLPDNRFDTVPLLDLVKQIERIKESVLPDTVYTHHHGDLNVDHRIVFEAVLTAFRPIARKTVRNIYSFEVGSSTEWAPRAAGRVFRPNHYVEIAGTLDRKIKAMRAYRSEAKGYPHPRSSRAIRARASVRGSEAGLNYAEAFEVVRQIDGA